MKNSKRTLGILLAVIAAVVLTAVFGIEDQIKGVMDMRFGIDIRGGVEAVFEPKDFDRAPDESEMAAARTVIESRLDAKNILDREVTVDKKDGYIIVRFPWKSDETSFNPEEAISELGEMAKLTFKDPEGNIMLEGKNVQSSSVKLNEMTNQYEVQLSFDQKGASLFADATEQLMGKNMGIYMDDQLISNPVVEQKITGGNAVINGMKNFDEAKSLSDKINSGALPFSLKTSNYSTISPSLGNGALAVMVTSGLIAFLVVCLFMIFYYKLPGIVACITLILQMSLQLLALSAPQYTLTLPGIAGIILSLGMAVDANIIIAERISEELKKGYSVASSIKTGYKNGVTSVMDGNITSAIVAVILMIFGSGAMLSFGYTLLTGLILNVFVGVIVSKKILLSLVTFGKLNDARRFREKKARAVIPFYKKKKIFFTVSAVLLLGGLAVTAVKGVKLDCQFTGGVVLNYTYDGEADTELVREKVNKIVNRPATVQMTTDSALGKKRMVITLAGNEGMDPDEQARVTDSINKIGNGFRAELSETYVVEPYIGKKALDNSIIAIGLSGILITCYVWIRFSILSGLSAGITAMIALVHDVFIVFFTFILFGIPLNDAFVAVVLTIIGYSINDTIVLYDRIRENKKYAAGMPAAELVDSSITQTLARSVNTSFTTGVCVFIILISAVLYGIDSIRVFALPMMFGLISGCYSSVCIAGILWAMWKRRGEKKAAGAYHLT